MSSSTIRIVQRASIATVNQPLDMVSVARVIDLPLWFARTTPDSAELISDNRFRKSYGELHVRRNS
jgi:hypothetical protein